MIARSLNMQNYSYEADVVSIDIKMTEAVADTPVVARGSRAVASISNAVAGIYIVTLNDTFANFLGANFCLLDSEASEDWTFYIKAIDLTAKTITFQAMIAGTATDIDTDATLYINLRMGATSLNMG